MDSGSPPAPGAPSEGRLRPLSVPRSIHVRSSSGGVPIFVRLPGRPARRVAVVRESWRVDDEWWRDPVSRAHFTVIVEGGGQLAIYRDLITGEWFAQRQ